MFWILKGGDFNWCRCTLMLLYYYCHEVFNFIQIGPGHTVEIHKKTFWQELPHIKGNFIECILHLNSLDVQVGHFKTVFFWFTYKSIQTLGKGACANFGKKHTQNRTLACACAIGILAKRTRACDVRAAENLVCECACVRANKSSQLTVW